MKTYVLMISKTFMKSHPRAGEYTFFKEAIEAGIQGKRLVTATTSRRFGYKPPLELKEQAGKIHTIRENYDLWKHRADEINAGRAILSLRQWTKSPYNYARDGSKQKEFLKLTKIGVQRVGYEHHMPALFVDGGCKKNLEFHFSNRVAVVAQNDGLSLDDFFSWFPESFSDYAIIHFTDFRY